MLKRRFGVTARSASATLAPISAAKAGAIRCAVAVAVGLGLVVWLSLLAAPAGGVERGAERVVEVHAPGPGPERFDKVYVHQVGPRSAKRVLVLMPGLTSGAGNFAFIAPQIVQRIPNLQVWSIDRRSQVLEDTTMFEKLEAGKATPDEAYDYYLGWLSDPSITDHTQFLDASTVPFARRWGMKTALNAAHQVVERAGRKGRNVILGGHSLGASLAEAYAAWDFRGRPGYKDINGIVLIDGGLLGAFPSYDPLTLADAKQAIDELRTSSPFEDPSGVGLPEAYATFIELLAYYTRLEPTEPATTMQSFPFLPPPLQLGFPVTNRALLGYSTDRTYEALGRRDWNAGQLTPSGEPRDWVDGGVTPIANIALYFGHEPGNGVEWYFPTRLEIDWLGADQMRMNSVARFLSLRLEHTRRIKVPIYAFQTDLTGGGVLRGVRRLIKESRITHRQALLVNGAPDYSHSDPLTAAPDNEFVGGLQDFLADYVKPSCERAKEKVQRAKKMVARAKMKVRKAQGKSAKKKAKKKLKKAKKKLKKAKKQKRKKC